MSRGLGTGPSACWSWNVETGCWGITTQGPAAWGHSTQPEGAGKPEVGERGGGEDRQCQEQKEQSPDMETTQVDLKGISQVVWTKPVSDNLLDDSIYIPFHI